MASPRFHNTSVWVAAVLIGAVALGCAPKQAPVKENTPLATSAPKKIEPVTNRKPNPAGAVLIVEYHRIAKEEARWDRSIARFKKDLERLHKLGFRPVTLESYLGNRMDLPPGASPIVFTFDDSHPSQFQLLADGSLDPDCALGIWQAFSQKHPDFPIKATFYIVPPIPWGQKDLIAKKFQMLKEWGCEIGSHTNSHANLGKLTNEAANKELAQSASFIQANFGQKPASIALPYGISPKDPSVLVKNGLTSALLVGSNPAPAPNDPKLNPMRLPRIQAIEGDYGLTFWLDKIEKGDVKPFVAK